MAQNTGTLISAAVRPNDSTDPIASAFSNEIKGGNHDVTTIAQRDAIIVERRAWGMLCAVVDDGTPANNGTYVLKYGEVDTDITNNANWVLTNIPSAAGGGGGGTITGGQNVGDPDGADVFKGESGGLLQLRRILGLAGGGIIAELNGDTIELKLNLEELEQITGIDMGLNNTAGGAQSEYLFKAVKETSQSLKTDGPLLFENDNAPKGYDYGQCWSGYNWQNVADIDVNLKFTGSMIIKYQLPIYAYTAKDGGGNVTQGFTFLNIGSNGTGTVGPQTTANFQFTLDSYKRSCARDSKIETIDIVGGTCTVVTKEPHALTGACDFDIHNTGTTLDGQNITALTIVDNKTFTFATGEADQSATEGDIVPVKISSLLSSQNISTDIIAATGDLSTTYAELFNTGDGVLRPSDVSNGDWKSVPVYQSGEISINFELGAFNFLPGEEFYLDRNSFNEVYTSAIMDVIGGGLSNNDV